MLQPIELLRPGKTATTTWSDRTRDYASLLQTACHESGCRERQRRPNDLKLPAITFSAIFVREENPPVNVEKPIKWLLLTNTTVASFEKAHQVIGWHCCRWQIEVFHKILKSGCRVEGCRLQTADCSIASWP